MPTVAVEGACPNQEAVQTILRSLLPAADQGTPPGSATIVDRGDAFVVAAAGRTKTYPDADRNCGQRARIAAAFIALVLEPGSAPPEGEPVAAPASAAVAPRQESPKAPPPHAAARPWARLDVRGAFQVSSPLGLTSPGAALELEGGWGALGAGAVCTWLAGAAMPLPVPGATALLDRLPCAVGPVVRLYVRPELETDLRAGVAVGAVRAGGQGLAAGYASARLEVGTRVAVDVSLRLSPDAHLVPVAGVEINYYPVPYDLAVTPRGVVASTPSLWAGVTAGICWNAL
jgi:hypothetical protein